MASDSLKWLNRGRCPPRPGRRGRVVGNGNGNGLSEEEARVRAIAEIVNGCMIERSHRGENVDLNALKTAACQKIRTFSCTPKLVEMIAALPESESESLLPLPRLRAKPVRTASAFRYRCGCCDV